MGNNGEIVVFYLCKAFLFQQTERWRSTKTEVQTIYRYYFISGYYNTVMKKKKDKR